MPRRLGIVAAALALAACSSTGVFSGRGRESQSAAGSEATTEPAPTGAAALDTRALEGYLEMMESLIEGDALDRAATFNAARDAFALSRTTTNELRYALALSIPGHNGSDAEAATVRLRNLIASGDLLREERVLVTIQLRYAEQIVRLEGAQIELEQRLEAAVTARDEETANLILRLQTDNAELRAELEDATAMLDAITNIEQSISEREDDDEN